MTDFDFSTHLDQVLSDPSRRRRFARNRVVVDTAVALNKAVEASGWTQKELAERLERTEGYVSQVLSGGANMTLRTLGDFAYGLDCTVTVSLAPALTEWQTSKTSWTSSGVDSTKVSDDQYALAA